MLSYSMPYVVLIYLPKCTYGKTNSPLKETGFTLYSCSDLKNFSKLNSAYSLWEFDSDLLLAIIAGHTDRVFIESYILQRRRMRLDYDYVVRLNLRCRVWSIIGWWWSWTIGWLSYKTENILGILHHNVCLTLPGRVESYFSYSIMTCYYLLYVPDDFKSDYKNFDKSNVPENKPNLYFKIMQRSVQSCIIPCRWP